MIRESLTQEIGEHQLYHARREDFATDDTVPFRVADEPLRLPESDQEQLQTFCQEVAGYFSAVDELYRSDERVRQLLDRGKPELFRRERDSQYLFLRPDLIITDDGFTLCEIETSVFGLGLTRALEQAYRSEGAETLADGELDRHMDRELSPSGVILDSNKTGAYRGQLEYLAERVFSQGDRSWQVDRVGADAESSDAPDSIYRAFYLKEYETDAGVREVIEQGEANGTSWRPSLTPHMEEKAVMALIWDERWSDYFETELGSAACDYLRSVIPKTFIVGEEEHFMPGLPGNVPDLAGIAGLSRSKRQLVSKPSGFDDNGSWAEGVVFLHKLSREKATTALGEAAAKANGLQIIQEFHQGRKVPMSVTEDGERQTQDVRVRLTPYVDPRTGKIVAAKATGRSGTDLIHGSSDSINTSVGVS